jgi:hypothetical protein
MIPEVFAQANKTTFPTIGGLKAPGNINELIQYVFGVVLVILGILIFWRLIRAGIAWMLAGDEPTKVQQAKSMIWNAFLGALLILGAWLILNTISPSLTNPNVDIPSPIQVTFEETMRKNKGIVLCKGGNITQENCINITEGADNIKDFIDQGYTQIRGFGDGQNYAIFFSEPLATVNKPGSAYKVAVWTESEGGDNSNLSGMQSVIAGKVNPSGGNKMEVILCSRPMVDIPKGEEQQYCQTFSTQGEIQKLSCTKIEVCNEVREIKINTKGKLLLTQDSNFNGYALYLEGPSPNIEVGGVAPSGVWAKQDKCIRKNQEVDCATLLSSGESEPIKYLPPYIKVGSIMLIPPEKEK